jgi:hypothetical protein
MRQLMIRFFMAICVFIFSGIVSSQSMNYGVKGGFTMSNLSIDTEDLDDENARIGIHAGLFSQVMFTGNIGILPEFLFTHKGTEGNYKGLVSKTVNYNLSYIDIPILLILRPVEILEIHAGSHFGGQLKVMSNTPASLTDIITNKYCYEISIFNCSTAHPVMGNGVSGFQPGSTHSYPVNPCDYFNIIKADQRKRNMKDSGCAQNQILLLCSVWNCFELHQLMNPLQVAIESLSHKPY